MRSLSQMYCEGELEGEGEGEVHMVECVPRRKVLWSDYWNSLKSLTPAFDGTKSNVAIPRPLMPFSPSPTYTHTLSLSLSLSLLHTHTHTHTDIEQAEHLPKISTFMCLNICDLMSHFLKKNSFNFVLKFDKTWGLLLKQKKRKKL